MYFGMFPLLYVIMFTYFLWYFLGNALRIFGARVFVEVNSQIRCTALIAAAESGHTHCVRALLEAGADKEAKDKPWVPHAPTQLSTAILFWSASTSSGDILQSCREFIILVTCSSGLRHHVRKSMFHILVFLETLSDTVNVLP
jgi:hypothetical protein